MSAKANTRPPEPVLGYREYLESLHKKQKHAQHDEGASAHDPSTTCAEAQPAQDESAPVPPTTGDEDSDEDTPLDIVAKKNAAKALQKEKEEASEREKQRLVGLNLASKEREKASKDVYGSKRPVGKQPLTKEEITKALRKARDDARPEYDRVVLGIGAKVQLPTKKEKISEQVARALKRDAKQDELAGYRSSDEERTYDDREHGAVSDSAEIKKDRSGNSIYQPPAPGKRVKGTSAKFNPRGPDTVLGKIVQIGFMLTVGFKGMGVHVDDLFASEVYVSFNADCFTQLNYSYGKGKWVDGSRNHAENLNHLIGWTVHSTDEFIFALQGYLMSVLKRPCSYETAKSTLETHMNKNGVHRFVHGQMVIFLDENGDVYDDKALKITKTEEESEDDSEDDEDEEFEAESQYSDSVEGTNSEPNSSLRPSSDSNEDEESEDEEEDDEEEDDEEEDDEEEEQEPAGEVQKAKEEEEEDEVVVMQEPIPGDSDEDDEEDEAYADVSDSGESDVDK